MWEEKLTENTHLKIASFLCVVSFCNLAMYSLQILLSTFYLIVRKLALVYFLSGQFKSIIRKSKVRIEVNAMNLGHLNHYFKGGTYDGLQGKK